MTAGQAQAGLLCWFPAERLGGGTPMPRILLPGALLGGPAASLPGHSWYGEVRQVTPKGACQMPRPVFPFVAIRF